MEERKLGSLTVSLCGLGCNNFGGRLDEERTAAVVHAALDAGVTLFDTADVYGGSHSEVFLGRALGKRRDEAIIATKFAHTMGEDPEWLGGGSARWIERAAESSLRRLGTDRIDLYQMHVPDTAVPIEETLEALDRLVRAGSVREIGCSNFSGEQIDAAAASSGANGWPRFVSAQNQYSLLHRDPEEDVAPACERNGLGLLPYFPLASGVLTGKYRRGEPPREGTRLASVPAERAQRMLDDRTFDVVEGLEAFAAARGRTVLEVAMSWLASSPLVPSVIAGATAPDQVEANAAAVSWRLSADERTEIDAITRRTP